MQNSSIPTIIKNRHALSLITAMTLVSSLNISCGQVSNSTTQDTAPLAPYTPSKRSDFTYCPITAEKSSFDEYLATSTDNQKYIVRPTSNLTTCPSSNTGDGHETVAEISGFRGMKILTVPVAVGPIKFDYNPELHLNFLKLPVQATDLTDADKAEVVTKLKTRNDYRPLIESALEEYHLTYALIPGVPYLTAISSGKNKDEPKTWTISIYSGRDYYNEEIAFIEDFNSGLKPLVLLVEDPYTLDFTVITIYAANSSQSPNSITPVAYHTGIKTLWDSIPQKEPEFGSSRNELLRMASKAIKSRNLSGETARTHYPSLLTYSEHFWKTQHNEFYFSAILIDCLRFLALTDPSTEILPYINKLEQIEARLWPADSKVLVDAIHWLVEHPKYSPEQESALLDFVLELQKVSSTTAKLWDFAASTFDQLANAPSRLALFTPLTQWLKNPKGPAMPFFSDTLTLAMHLIIDLSATAETIETYKNVYVWLSTQTAATESAESGPGLGRDEALKKAENYTFAKKISDEKFSQLRAAFSSYLTSKVAANEALELAEKDTFR